MEQRPCRSAGIREEQVIGERQMMRPPPPSVPPPPMPKESAPPLVLAQPIMTKTSKPWAIINPSTGRPIDVQPFGQHSRVQPTMISLAELAGGCAPVPSGLQPCAPILGSSSLCANPGPDRTVATMEASIGTRDSCGTDEEGKVVLRSGNSPMEKDTFLQVINTIVETCSRRVQNVSVECSIATHSERQEHLDSAIDEDSSVIFNAKKLLPSASECCEISSTASTASVGRLVLQAGDVVWVRHSFAPSLNAGRPLRAGQTGLVKAVHVERALITFGPWSIAREQSVTSAEFENFRKLDVNQRSAKSIFLYVTGVLNDTRPLDQIRGHEADVVAWFGEELSDDFWASEVGRSSNVWFGWACDALAIATEAGVVPSSGIITLVNLFPRLAAERFIDPKAPISNVLRPFLCPSCSMRPPSATECKNCDGKGAVKCAACVGSGFGFVKTCRLCSGSGKRIGGNGVCRGCGGSGVHGWGTCRRCNGDCTISDVCTSCCRAPAEGMPRPLCNICANANDEENSESQRDKDPARELRGAERDRQHIDGDYKQSAKRDIEDGHPRDARGRDAGRTDAADVGWRRTELDNKDCQRRHRAETKKTKHQEPELEHIQGSQPQPSRVSASNRPEDNAERSKQVQRRMVVKTDDGCFDEGRVCLLSLRGECSDQTRPCCDHGHHPQMPISATPREDDVLVNITRAKMRLLQEKWTEAGGSGELYGAWQVRNRRLDRLFRATAHNLFCEIGHTSDAIDGWHGTPDQNVLSIAQTGFDAGRRVGQVYGAGEYFAKDPKVSVSYARGGSFMFLCKLLLGQEETDHTWVNQMKYYVIKQRNGFVQALPLYVVQFKPSTGSVARALTLMKSHEAEDDGSLRQRQRGGNCACEGRRDAGMAAQYTKHLWLGWLAPELCRANDDAVADDVREFLQGFDVDEVIPERNGARIGAFVRLQLRINKQQFTDIAARRYRGRFRISVDDQQPLNPRCVGKPCPRLTGPSRYCRGWNIRGHHAWQWGCPFDHPHELRPTHGATYTLEAVAPGTAKYDDIETALLSSAPFHNGRPRLVRVQRVVNPALEAMYEKRRNFLTEKLGSAMEKDLWHGTNCKALPELLTHGLQPPSDTRPSDVCPISGGKGLCTTLCGTSCSHCHEPHCWDKCHMYGLGIYLADLAQKSHRYVREPPVKKVELPAFAKRGVGAQIQGVAGDCWGTVVDDQGDVWRLLSGRIAKKQNEGLRWNWVDPKESTGLKSAVHSMIYCRTCLGSPYMIESNLLGPSAMHDMCWCKDPSDQLESVCQDWNVAQGHDSFYVKGMSGTQRQGLGVHNSEYIIFQPYQVLPLYVVDYIIE